MTENWRAFVVNFELARQALASEQIIQTEESVDQAMNHLKTLIAGKFLITYPKLDGTYRQFRDTFSRYMNQEFKHIEQAAKDYFSKVFCDSPEFPSLNVRCEKQVPDERIQDGLLCKVLRNEVLIGKYYVKEHMGLAKWPSADIREIFVYKLFELIGVGPRVHFVPNVHHSSFGLYIAAEEVRGLRRADTEGLQMSNLVSAQRDLIRRLLLLGDVHSKNYGIDDNGNLSIVAFRIKSVLDSQMHKYLDGYASWEGSKELRVQVAKDFIEARNLPETFDKADHAIIMQKELFRKHSNNSKPRKNLEDYLMLIKNNLNALIQILK